MDLAKDSMLLYNESGVYRECEKESEVSLPLGQQCLRAGFKAVTIGELSERFCCDAITESHIKDIEEKALRDYKHMVLKNGKIYIGRSDWRNHIKVVVDNGFFRGNLCWHIRCKICVVKLESLDSYIGDVVPERCLLLIEKARHLGIKEFKVAYPVLEEVKLKDPVVLGVLGNNYLEICMWE